MPAWMVAPVGDPLGDERGDAAVDRRTARRRHLHEGSIHLHQPDDLAEVDLVGAEGAGMRSLTSRKNGTCPMNGAT